MNQIKYSTPVRMTFKLYDPATSKEIFDSKDTAIATTLKIVRDFLNKNDVDFCVGRALKLGAYYGDPTDLNSMDAAAAAGAPNQQSTTTDDGSEKTTLRPILKKMDAAEIARASATPLIPGAPAVVSFTPQIVPIVRRDPPPPMASKTIPAAKPVPAGNPVLSAPPVMLPAKPVPVARSSAAPVVHAVMPAVKPVPVARSSAAPVVHAVMPVPAGKSAPVAPAAKPVPAAKAVLEIPEPNIKLEYYVEPTVYPPYSNPSRIQSINGEPRREEFDTQQSSKAGPPTIAVRDGEPRREEFDTQQSSKAGPPTIAVRGRSKQRGNKRENKSESCPPPKRTVQPKAPRQKKDKNAEPAPPTTRMSLRSADPAWKEQQQAKKDAKKKSLYR